jgi:SnoaL-like domain
MAQTHTIEERLQNLEDVEAIKRLRSLYALFWDAGFKSDDDPSANASQLAELFTEGALWAHVDGSYSVEGRTAIRDFTERILRSHGEDEKGQSRQFTGIALHILGNDVIDVNGDTATARWNGLVGGSVADRELAYWMGLHYEGRFVRTEQGWKYDQLLFDIAFTTKFDGPGWVKEKFEEANT